MRSFYLISLFVLTLIIGRTFQVSEGVELQARATLALGFILLVGPFFGHLSERLKMPRLTGYILLGILCGPYLINIFQSDVVSYLRLIDRLALCLIAFTAGGELYLNHIKPHLKSIGWILLFQTLVGFLGVAVVFWFARDIFPFAQGQELKVVLVMAALLGAVSLAKSPAQTVAVIVETGARGPMTEIIMAIVIARDILVIFVFTLLLSFAQVLLSPGGSFSTGNLTHLLAEIIGSLFSGVIFGGLAIAYLKFIRRHLLVFIWGLALLILSFSAGFHLDPLLIAIGSGFMVANFSGSGKHLIEAIEQAGMPVFLVFFTLAGAALNLDTFAQIWPLALFICVIRAVTIFFGTGLGARLARERENVRRYAWTGFIGQAGITLGFASLIAQGFPSFGAPMNDLIIGAVVVNSLIGPVLHKWGTIKAGEARVQFLKKG